MDQEILNTLQRMEQYSKQQSRAAKFHCVISVISLICCVAALFTVIRLVPQVRQLTAQTEAFIESAEDALEDVRLLSEKLSQVDMGPVLVEMKDLLENVDGLLTNVDTLVSNVDTLVATTQGGLEDTLEKIESVDFEKLNKAIKDLAAVVEPLANFFNSFNR